MNKKVIGIIAIIIVVIALIFVFSNKDKNKQPNVEGSLEEIMAKLYDGIPEDELPMLENTQVTPENIEYYLGTSDIEYTEALASEPLMSSIAHSVVLVRVDDKANVNDIKDKIRNSINPRKWICVAVEDKDVKVESKGNLVVLIMVNDQSDKILENFNKL